MHKVLVNRLVKLAQEKSVDRWTDCPDVKDKTKNPKMIKFDFCYQTQEWCQWLLSEYISKQTVILKASEIKRLS